MDSGLITAITALLTAAGAAVGFFIRRADKRRETNEALLIENLRTQLAEAKATAAVQIAEAKKEARRWKLAWQLADADAAAYREQLIVNDIPPEPAHRTPLPEEDE